MNTGPYNTPLHQSLTLTVAPTSEPVTLAEAKDHVRRDDSDDDALIAGLITAARQYAETAQKRQLMPATYELRLDSFPTMSPASRSWVGPTIFLPMPRLIAVSSIAYVNQSGTLVTLDPSSYTVDSASSPGRITPVYWQTWPNFRPTVGCVRVTYTAGYADAAHVPETTKLAMKLLIGHWYKNRESNSLDVGGPMELAVASLLAVDSVGSYF